MYQELQTNLKKAIQDNSSAVFQKIKQGAPTDSFSSAIPAAQGTIPSAADSALDVLREESPSGVSFGVTDRTLEDDSGVVSGIAIPSHNSGDHEVEDSDVIIISTTPATQCKALAEIPIPQHARGSRPAEIAPRNIFEVSLSEQTQAVGTIQMMTNDEDKSKILVTDIEVVATTPAPASVAVVASKDLLPSKLNLSAKELKWLQDMIASEVGMEHLLQTAAQQGIDMPVLQNLPPPPDPPGEVAAVQLKFPIEGLVLLAVNTTMDPGNKDDGKVNKECLRYDLGKFPLKPSSCDGSWSRETCVLSQARMAAYTRDSPTVFALQHGFHLAWLQALGLKKECLWFLMT